MDNHKHSNMDAEVQSNAEGPTMGFAYSDDELLQYLLVCFVLWDDIGAVKDLLEQTRICSLTLNSNDIKHIDKTLCNGILQSTSKEYASKFERYFGKRKSIPYSLALNVRKSSRKEVKPQLQNVNIWILLNWFYFVSTMRMLYPWLEH